jgi:hypothetical protein
MTYEEALKAIIAGGDAVKIASEALKEGVAIDKLTFEGGQKLGTPTHQTYTFRFREAPLACIDFEIPIGVPPAEAAKQAVPQLVTFLMSRGQDAASRGIVLAKDLQDVSEKATGAGLRLAD